MNICAPALYCFFIISDLAFCIGLVVRDHVVLSVPQKFCAPINVHAVCMLAFAVDALVGQLLVPTLQFVLFLYVQHIQKISLRASLVSGSDEYPLCSYI